MGASYADFTYDVDHDVQDEILTLVADEPRNPWDLIDIVSDAEHDEEEVRTTLRVLVERGQLAPTGTGKLRAATI